MCASDAGTARSYGYDIDNKLFHTIPIPDETVHPILRLLISSYLAESSGGTHCKYYTITPRGVSGRRTERGMADVLCEGQ